MSKSYSDIREALYKKATPDQVDIAEQTDEPASEDEAGMAMDQAKFIGYVAEEIMEYLQGNNDFPEWMQNKLTGFHEKAKDMHAVMAGKYESVQEAKFTDKQIKMAYGVANDKRYKGGNYTGAVRAIEKIAKGLSDHPDVKKVLKVTNESLRSDIAKLSAKFPEGSKVKMKHDGKVAKVVSVGKDFVKVAVGNKTMDHKPDELEKINEAAYKVPSNYAAIKARLNKKSKVSDAQINKVLGPTKNAQQGIEALKKAFKVSDDEAKAMIKRVMPTEETVAESTMYLVKMRDGSKHKKTMDAAGAEKMKKNPEVLSVSVIGNVAEADVEIMEAIDMSKAGKYARVMNPKTREIKKVLKTDLKKYVDKGWTHMTQLKNRLTKEVAEESIDEKLKVSDGMGTWIKDFQDSDAPQFKGKSDKERRDMAIAAYMSAKRDMKESATLDEALDSIVAKLMKMKGDAESIANSLTPVQLKDISRNEAEFLRKYKNKNAKEILKLVKDIQG